MLRLEQQLSAQFESRFTQQADTLSQIVKDHGERLSRSSQETSSMLDAQFNEKLTHFEAESKNYLQHAQITLAKDLEISHSKVPWPLPLLRSLCSSELASEGSQYT